MLKNIASQKWVVFAFDRTDNTPKAGDAAQITAKISIDIGAAGATDDTNPTEIEDGYYYFNLTQAETNGDMIHILPESSTGDIQVIGCPGVVFTTSLTHTRAGYIDELAAANIPADVDAIKAKTDSLTFTVAGDVDCNVQMWKGAAAENMTGDAFARLGAPAGASVSADIVAVKAETAAIVDDTGTAGVVVAAGSKTGYSLAADQSSVTIGTVTNLTNAATDGDLTATMKASVNAEVDTALNTAIPGSPTAASINAYIQQIKFIIKNKMTIAEDEGNEGNTVVYADDGTTPYCSVSAAFSSNSTTTTRKALE